MYQFDILKKANLKIIEMLEADAANNQGQIAMSSMSAQLTLIQGQNDSLNALLLKLMESNGKQNCEQLEALFKTEISGLQGKIDDIWQRYSGLMKTNQELNSYILKLQEQQGDFELAQNKFQNAQEEIAALKSENNNMTLFIKSLRDNQGDLDQVYE